MLLPTDQEIILTLGEELPVGLWVARAPNGELVYANRTFSQIMGMSPRADVQVGGYAKPYGIYNRSGELYPEHRMPFVRAMAERRTVVVDDITIHRGDGTRVDVRAFARPVGDPITHVIVAFFDISREIEAEQARAESERRLQHAQRLESIGTLAGGIAHDFNNLIFGIKLIAAGLETSERDPGKLESLRTISELTDRSASLTRSLLTFARRGKHRAAPVALDDVVSSMSELLRRTLAGVDLAFQLEATNRGTVVGDQTQLEQVILNLVLNARDAVQGNGRVSIRTSNATGPRGQLVQLEVTDDGPGIPHELRGRVFEPYFTTKTQGSERGMGLGLATVFGIVSAHGGTIEVDDGFEGRGTTMRVQLPTVNQVPQDTSTPELEGRPAGSGTVLIVDDDETVRQALVGTIESLGYQTLAATGGAEAVALFAEHRHSIQVVLLDMVMRGMNGKTTYLALRDIDPAVRVALMSGFAFDEDVQEILTLGVQTFLPKPYSVETLASRLAELTR